MRTRTAAILLLSVALCACGRQSGSGEPEGAGTPAPTTSTQRTGDDAAPAVLQSTGAPVAQLSYIIDTRPVVAEPFTVKLRASSATPVPELQVLASAEEMIIAPEAGTIAIEKADAPATHELIVTAPRPGLTLLNVRLKSGEGAETVYAVPVLVSAAGS